MSTNPALKNDTEVIDFFTKIFPEGVVFFDLETTGLSPLCDRVIEFAGIKKGSGEPNKDKVGVLKRHKVKEIAEIKMPDLNSNDLESSMRMVEGTARSMGVTVED